MVPRVVVRFCTAVLAPAGRKTETLKEKGGVEGGGAAVGRVNAGVEPEVGTGEGVRPGGEDGETTTGKGVKPGVCTGEGVVKTGEDGEVRLEGTGVASVGA